MNITEVSGHSYTDTDLERLVKQAKTKRWAVSIFEGETMLHLTKWHTSAKAAKTDALVYIDEHR